METDTVAGKKKVCVVCFANYCRSPVAEAILNHLYSEKIEVISAGISPFVGSNMDRRSSEYLLSKGIGLKIHTPKKINQTIVIQSDFIYAIDPSILMQLNKLFPSHTSKIKLLNYSTPRLIMRDPYKLGNEDYLNVMERIFKVCENLELA